MSHRAIQRLRAERESALPVEDASDDEEEEDHRPARKTTAFVAMMDSDSDDESESSIEAKDDDKKSAGHDIQQKQDVGSNITNKAVDDSEGDSKSDDQIPKVDPSAVLRIGEKQNEGQDLDALLEEFKLQDKDPEQDCETSEKPQASWYRIVTSNMDIRDLDVEYVMRTSLFGSSAGESAPRPSRRGRQVFLFGPAREGWIRPPHYVGGGIGMSTYDISPRPLPWPYSQMKEGEKSPGLDRWFTFTHSDSYQRDCRAYERIKASGDPNALVLFVAQHPFVTEALLQLAAVLYQTNQSQEGLALLRRAVWVYECSSLSSLAKMDGRDCFVDSHQPENNLFFLSLFRLIRVSYVQGLARASLAVSRYVLSLDPLRDPMGVLLALDHFALLSNSEVNDRWLVAFVESHKVQIYYRDDSSKEEYECKLLDLPNWAYSYALALYRVHQSTPSENSEQKSKSAIKTAVGRFPSVLDLLLHANEVDISGRSFQTDWPSVLGYTSNRSKDLLNAWSRSAVNDPVVRACTSQAHDLIVRIFVKQNHKLYGSEAVLRWIYDGVSELKGSGSESPVPPLSPALMRYARSDPSDYEDKFQTMPADANPLDPGLLVHALAMDPNRPRLLQRMPRGDGGQDEIDFAAQQLGTPLAGPPTQNVDPDWPFLEVFWRSALPWNHVEGVPPPRR